MSHESFRETGEVLVWSPLIMIHQQHPPPSPQHHHHNQQQQHQNSNMLWIRKVSSPRFLLLLVCFLIGTITLRNGKSLHQILPADPLIVWTEPFFSENDTAGIAKNNHSYGENNHSNESSTRGYKNPYLLVKRPKRTNGTLYRCGFGTGRLIRLLFDDFLSDDDDPQVADDGKSVPWFTKDNITNPNDIIYFGSVSGPCNGINKEWLHDNFPGKVLFQNGESHGDGRGPKSYMISSLETSERNVHVPFVSAVFVGQIPRRLGPILFWKDTPRPRNNGKHFMVYATSHCVAFRDKVAAALSAVNVIHHGNCRPDNMDNFTALPNEEMGYEWSTNYQIFSNFRFCLVMENLQQRGYITEKILNAFLGGCIPIWYGTTDIWNIFHRDSFLFVDALDNASVRALVERVRYLEENSTAYDEVLAQPILANGNVTLEQYFSLDDSIGQGQLKHAIRVMLGLEDEQYRQLM